MPITRRQFDLGIDEDTEACMRQIHKFLASQKSKAFSREETFAALSGTVSLKRFNVALEKLIELRAVDRRDVKGEPYYAYLEDLDRIW
jgi:hypothetical protein